MTREDPRTTSGCARGSGTAGDAPGRARRCERWRRRRQWRRSGRRPVGPAFGDSSIDGGSTVAVAAAFAASFTSAGSSYMSRPPGHNSTGADESKRGRPEAIEGGVGLQRLPRHDDMSSGPRRRRRRLRRRPTIAFLGRLRPGQRYPARVPRARRPPSVARYTSARNCQAADRSADQCDAPPPRSTAPGAGALRRQ